MNSQIKMCMGQGLEGPQAQEPLSLWSWGATPSRMWTCSPTWKLSKLPSSGIFWRLHHISMINNYHSPFFPQRIEDEA